MIGVRPACRALSLAAIALMLVSCASTGRTGGDASSGVAVVEDPSFRLLLERSDADAGRAVRYVVEAETIAFGGGTDAIAGRESWQGALSAEDRAALGRLLERDGWLVRDLAGSGQPRGTRGTVRIRWSAGSQRHSLRGESAELDRLVEALEKASRARFDRILRELPQPGEPGR